MTRNKHGSSYYIRLIVLFSGALLLLQALGACGTDPHTTSFAGTRTAPSSQSARATATQPGRVVGPALPSPTPKPALQGPANFLLTTPFNFSSVSGATSDDDQTLTPIDTNTIKTAITGEMKHLLFVVGDSNVVKVYSPGTSPITAHVTQNADGSTLIDYTQTVDSEAGTVTILFDGIVLKGQITVTYEQQYAPSILINAVASDVAVSFTTQVHWIAANQIPAAPRNAAYQLMSNGGVTLSWKAGQNAVVYDVYRQISDHDQQFQLLATVKSTSYTDSSPEAIQNIRATKGITYVIFSVGPTGVENPGGIVLSL